MIYGLDRRAFIENGPAVRADQVRRARDSVRYRLWQRLDGKSRLSLVERALHPAGGQIDGYPPAL